MRQIWWENERELHVWLSSRMKEQGWDHTFLNDSLKVGLPDLSASHRTAGECWIEVKLVQKARTVHDFMKLEHPLSAQQKAWLTRRQSMGHSTCGVLVGWRTVDGTPEGFLPYLTFVPITEWPRVMANTLMAWGLSYYTMTASMLLEPDALMQLVKGRSHY